MPVLTKDQVLQAAFELSPEDRQEIWELIAEQDRPLYLSDEEKKIILAELEAYKQNPEDVITWEDLKAELRAQSMG